MIEAGIYKGNANLYFKPGDPPVEGAFTFTVEPAADGLVTLIRYEGVHGEDKSVGVATLATNKRKGKLQMAWQDSFHMADEPMALEGDGLEQLVGNYWWEGTPHEWRIAIAQHAPGQLEWRMYNRMVGIPEYLGVETILTRV